MEELEAEKLCQDFCEEAADAAIEHVRLQLEAAEADKAALLEMARGVAAGKLPPRANYAGVSADTASAMTNAKRAFNKRARATDKGAATHPHGPCACARLRGPIVWRMQACLAAALQWHVS